MSRMYRRFINNKKLHPGARFFFSIDVKNAKDYRILKRRMKEKERKTKKMILDYRSRVAHRPCSDSEHYDFFSLALL